MGFCGLLIYLFQWASHPFVFSRSRGMPFPHKYLWVACNLHQPMNPDQYYFGSNFSTPKVINYMTRLYQNISSTTFNKRPPRTHGGRLYRLYQHVVRTVRYPSAHPILIISHQPLGNESTLLLLVMITITTRTARCLYVAEDVCIHAFYARVHVVGARTGCVGFLGWADRCFSKFYCILCIIA